MKKVDFNRGWYVRREHGTEVRADLPYDAMIHEKRDPDCLNGKTTGYFPGGKYIYRKEFELGEYADRESISFEFEGVYQNAEVYLNGHKVCFHPYGYTGFIVEADPYLNRSGMNEILVTADNSGEPSTRWYSGSGIYRPVWMHVGAAEHICPDGIRVKTISAGNILRQSTSRHPRGI